MSDNVRDGAAPQPKHTSDRKRFRLPVRKRALLAWGSLFAIGAIITTASFTDSEWAKTEVTTGSYNLQISDQSDAGFRDTLAEAPLEVNLASADGAYLIPGGRAASTSVWLKNIGDYRSTLSVTLTATPDPAGPAGQAYFEALEFSVNEGAFMTWEELEGEFNADGSITLDEIPRNETQQFTLAARLPGSANSAAMQEKSVNIVAQFDGESIPRLTPSP